MSGGVKVVRAEVIQFKGDPVSRGQWLRDMHIRAQGAAASLVEALTGGPMINTAKAKGLSSELDVDGLSATFRKHAGLNDALTRKEYDEFIKETKISSSAAASLWQLLDSDDNGTVTLEEFQAALQMLREARSVTRYCPTCQFRNECAFCDEVATCPDCSQRAFCTKCWANHPGRPDEARKAALSNLVVGSVEWVRYNLVGRPLELAYSTVAKTTLPIDAKATIRKAMRSEQLKSAATLSNLAANQREAPGAELEHLSAVWNAGARGKGRSSITWADGTTTSTTPNRYH